MHWYGNFENIALYSYLHVDVIDLHGFTIVIVTIKGALINFHLNKFMKRKHLRIETFFVQTHAKFEMGNHDVSLKVITSIVVDSLDDVDVHLWFFHIDIIVFFIQQIHEKWVIATFAVVVIRFQKKVDGHFNLVVVDGDSSNDIQTIQIQ